MPQGGFFEEKRTSPTSLAIVVLLHGVALTALMQQLVDSWPAGWLSDPSLAMPSAALRTLTPSSKARRMTSGRKVSTLTRSAAAPALRSLTAHVPTSTST